MSARKAAAGRTRPRRRTPEVVETTGARVADALRPPGDGFRDLVENINDVLFVLDQFGRITYISPVIEMVSGYPPREVVGRHFAEFVAPDDLERLAESFVRTVSGEPEPLDYRVVRKDGEMRWVRSFSRPITDGDQIVGVRGVLVDVTEQRRADAAVRESEARYRELFENANDAIYTHDLDGNLTSVNRRAEEMSGYTRAELLRMNVYQLLTPEHATLTRRLIEQSLGAHTRITCELDIVTKDGRTIPFEFSVNVVVHEGRPVGIQGIVRDLSERRQAQAQADARRRAEGQAQAASALARVGRELMGATYRPIVLDRLCRLTTEVLACDCSHTFFWDRSEDAFVPVAGYGDAPEQAEAIRVLKIPRPIVNRLASKLDRDEVAQAVMTTPQDLLSAPWPAQFGITVALFVALRRGTELVGFHSGCYRGRAEPFTAQQVQLIRGIAQLASLALENARLVEELKRANRLKSDFLATMSHELRTPLNVIIGYNQLLLDETFGPLGPEHERAAQRIDKSARELLSLIDATLAVTRLDTGGLPVDLKEIVLPDLLREVENDAHDKRDKPNVQFHCEIATDLPRLYSDPTKLKVVLKNLIANAFKFTEDGQVTIQAKARDGGIEIRVADTGIGIAREAQGTIFEPFWQASGTIAERYGGVGLGLYIVRRLLALLGGTIAVDSEPGRGSVFRVWLPPTFERSDLAVGF
jgi:PAS domain S-box-containing protein